MRKLSLFTAIILTTSTLIAQWEWQNPYPQSNSLNDVFFINTRLGWAVGDEGTIIKTEDGGITFDIILQPNEEDLNTATFIDSLVGFIAGDNGVILKTVNGGNDWLELSIDSILDFQDIAVSNQQKVWIAGENGIIVYSPDNGNTWEQQYYDANFYLNSICFADSNNGWAAGGNEFLLYTNNGGESWNTQKIDSALYSIKYVCFTDSLNGWASVYSDVYFNAIMHTDDGGITWEEQISNDIFYYGKVYFYDSLNGYVLIESSWPKSERGNRLIDPERYNEEYIIFTNDGGKSWSGHNFSITNGYLKSVHFINSNDGWLVGNNGQIHQTINGGINWESKSVYAFLYNLYDAHFTENGSGWAVGGGGTNLAVRFPIILKTWDFGRTWERLTFDNTGLLTDILFTTDSAGWLIGSKDMHTPPSNIYFTDDGGITWSINYSGAPNFLINDIMFISKDIGWVVGGSGTIMKTDDQGNTWGDQTSGTSEYLYGVCFVNENIGWAVGSGRVILHTNDGGQNWETQSLQGEGKLVKVQFIDSITGWAIGEWDESAENRYDVIFTNNGGETWKEIYSTNNSRIKDVFFADLMYGWILVNPNLILFTKDRGASWSSQEIGKYIYLNGLSFNEAGYGWAFGNKTTIVRTDYSGISNTEENDIVPMKISLVKIFPNPFTTSTTIAYKLQQPSSIQITIYNHLGKQIEVIKQNQSAGMQQVIWNAEKLPSGVYFCVLKTNEGTQTLKMIKMK